MWIKDNLHYDTKWKPVRARTPSQMLTLMQCKAGSHADHRTGLTNRNHQDFHSSVTYNNNNKIYLNLYEQWHCFLKKESWFKKNPFSDLSIAALWHIGLENSLLWEIVLGFVGYISSIFGLYSLHASSMLFPPVAPIKNVSGQCKMPTGGKITHSSAVWVCRMKHDTVKLVKYVIKNFNDLRKW